MIDKYKQEVHYTHGDNYVEWISEMYNVDDLFYWIHNARIVGPWCTYARVYSWVLECIEEDYHLYGKFSMRSKCYMIHLFLI